MSIRTVVESIVGGDVASDPESGDSTAGDGGDDFDGIADHEGDVDGLAGDGNGFTGLDDGDVEEGAGGQVDELEHRIDEVETQLDDLSSTVETVRTENEQISASVGDVEENVRKLLDIYEMVTSGVNPFADDVDAGAAGGSMGGDFGLFDDGMDDDGPEDGVDEEVAEADPEGFFDENLDGDDLTVDDEPAVDDVFDDENFDESAGPSAPESAPEPADGGTSFEDLKAEYDSEESASTSQKDAAPPKHGSETGTAPEVEKPADRQSSQDAERASPTDPDPKPDTSGAGRGPADSESEGARGARAPASRPTAESAAAPSPTPERAGVAVAHEHPGDHQRANGAIAGADHRPSARTRSAGRDDDPSRSAGPYLTSLPEGYATDLVVTEWLEPLVAKAGIREAARALQYYESIGWLGPAARGRLEDRLGGFVGGGEGALDTDDHVRSLQYVSQLNGAGDAAVGPVEVPDGGGSDGVQR